MFEALQANPTLDGYRAFLDAFPNGTYSEFARGEVAALEAGFDAQTEELKEIVVRAKSTDIALTATADQPTRNEILERLDLSSAQQFIASFDRPNICYRNAQSPGNARDALLRFILNEHEQDAGIVYCLSRKKVEQTAEWLCNKGLTALPYHAGLPAKTRQKHQQRFLMEDKVIIARVLREFFFPSASRPNASASGKHDLGTKTLF
mgnify:CR=1 FL=1